MCGTHRAMAVINKYKPIDTAPKRTASPVRMLVSVWCLALAACFWSADDLRQMLVHKDAFWGREALLTGVTALADTAEAIGLTQAKAEITRLAHVPYEHPVEIAFQEPPQVTVPTQQAQAAVVPTAVAPPVATPTPVPAQRAPARHAHLTPRVGKVLIVGASSIQYALGSELERRLEQEYAVEVHRLGKLSTSLARPDYFDWPATVSDLVAERQPDLVIAQFGGNDCQNMTLPDGKPVTFNSKAWRAEYATRVRDFAERAQSTGAELVMIGMPIMRSGNFSRRIAAVNGLIEEHATAAGATFVPTWDLASTALGKYRKSVEFEGDRGLMRMADGIHFSRLGGRYLASRVAQRVERIAFMPPVDGNLAFVQRGAYASELRQKSVPYLAFLPRALPEEGLPVLYLLHGAYDGYNAWASHDQRLLQRLAARHGMAIVTPDGEPHGWYLDSPVQEEMQIEASLVHELLPHVEATLPVSCVRSIAGLSMGGNGALKIALRHPGLFAAASSMSGVVDFTNARIREAPVRLLGPYENNPELWASHSAYHLAERFPGRARSLPLYFACGQEDRWHEDNVRLHELLLDLGVSHIWDSSPGGHTWAYWLGQLPSHVEWHAAHLHAAAATAEAHEMP